MLGTNKTRVGVIRGGPSSEYEVSLKTGGEVLKHLSGKNKVIDILFDKQGNWFFKGFPTTPAKIFNEVDVVFNALHGEYGEDGKIQQVFESHNIPYTGSEIIPSAMAMQKHRARDIFSKFGLKTPKALVFSNIKDAEKCAGKVFNKMSPSWVVKPASAGSSVGINICNSFPELVEGIREAMNYGNVFLVEEHIKGREATCGILENYRNENYYALPVVEIIPPQDTFFDYKVKYDGSTKEICPAGFDNSTKLLISEMAKLAHQALGCRHYSRADFIVSPRGIYLLEVNTLPGLTSESLLPKAAAATGLKFPQLLDHLIKLALDK